jgi:hypothetical protein
MSKIVYQTVALGCTHKQKEAPAYTRACHISQSDSLNPDAHQETVLSRNNTDNNTSSLARRWGT